MTTEQMVAERVNPRPTKPEDGIGHSAGLVRSERDVRLNFWFGPKKIGSAKFLMQVDKPSIDLFGVDLPQPPASRTRRPQDELVFQGLWETPF